MPVIPPPHDIPAERSVLGSVLINPAALDTVMEVMGTDPAGFYEPVHQKIYACYLEMFQMGVPIDAVTLERHLETGFRNVNGAEYIAGLITDTPTSAHCEEYARTVQACYTGRLLLHVCDQVRGKVSEDISEALELAEREVYALSVNRQTKPLVSWPEATYAVAEHLKAVASGLPAGIPSGIESLDGLTKGFQSGDMILLAARPSVGKTQLALNMAIHAAKQGRPVLLFSLEMALLQIAQRGLAILEKRLMSTFQDGSLMAPQLDKLRHGGQFPDLPFWIDDTPSQTLWELRSKARRWCGDHPGGMILIDYLQLLRLGGTNRFEKRYLEVAEISRAIKALGRELNTPIIACCQLNREADSIADHQRRLACLREAGDLEQDADLVMILSRLNGEPLAAYKAAHDGQDPDENLLKTRLILTLAKHRNGPTGQVWLHNDASLQHITEDFWNGKKHGKTTQTDPGEGYEGEDVPF